MRYLAALMLVAALLTGGAVSALADPPAADNVKALALRWYEQMDAGRLDRSQLAAAYSAQLPDEAVQAITRKVDMYGASPSSAEILQGRTRADQTGKSVKLIFPRGDATSFMIGF